MYKNALLQALIRTVFPYGSIRRVLRGPLRGVKFFIAPSMGLTYILGFDSMNWKFFRKHLKKGMVVFDIGANRGQMGLFFSKEVGPTGHVYCFEPMAHLASELKKNLEINDTKNVDTLPYALSDSNGKATFLFEENHSTQGKLSDVEASYVTDNASNVEVETRSLDTLIGDGLTSPKLLKIDVEGAASKVFEGAKELLDQHPDIYLELHGPEEQQSIGDYLVPRGYKFQDMDGNTIEDPVKNWCSPIWCSVNI